MCSCENFVVKMHVVKCRKCKCGRRIALIKKSTAHIFQLTKPSRYTHSLKSVGFIILHIATEYFSF